MGDAVCGNKSVGSSVVRLSFFVSPNAIFLAIRPVIVEAFNRMRGGWFSAHIPKECLKAFIPFGIDGNTARSVEPVFWVLRIIATGFHANPGDIFRRPLPAAFMSMPFVGAHAA